MGANREECPPERHVRTQVEVIWLEGVGGFGLSCLRRGMEDPLKALNSLCLALRVGSSRVSKTAPSSRGSIVLGLAI